MPKSIQFSNVDAAWLQMEDPTNLMMITGVLFLDRPVDLARLRKTIAYRLLPLDRFTMRITPNRLPMMPPKWESDPQFNLDWHLRHIALPGDGDETTLRRTISDLMSTGLDFSKPLWQFHLIDNVAGGNVLLGRIHHSIGDGTALVAVMLSLMDFTPDMPLKAPQPKDEGQEREKGLLHALFAPAKMAVGMGKKAADLAWREGSEMLAHPLKAYDFAQSAAKGAETLGRVTLMPADPMTPLKGKLGVKKLPAWSNEIPLADVKKVGKVMGAKVNDVLLTAMTGGLRRYLIERDVNVAGMNFRAAVPVNLRPMERALELGNEFSLIFLSLPVGIADPVERLFTLKKRMDAIKESPEAMVNFGLLNVVGAAPEQVADQIVNLFGSKATAVMTNVPGPPMPLYLAGAKIDKMIFWVPLSGRLGLGVSILSYAGKVTLGVATDAGLTPDPEKIIDGFHAEFDALFALAAQVEEDEANLAASVAKLESLEKQIAELEQMEPQSQHDSCAGTTKSGKPCRNKPIAGQAYCRHHIPQ